MSAIWKCHAMTLADIIKGDNETQAHLYLEQLMLLPFDIQDNIIEDISQLPHCQADAVANIICRYCMLEMRETRQCLSH